MILIMGSMGLQIYSAILGLLLGVQFVFCSLFPGSSDRASVGACAVGHQSRQTLPNVHPKLASLPVVLDEGIVTVLLGQNIFGADFFRILNNLKRAQRPPFVILPKLVVMVSDFAHFNMYWEIMNRQKMFARDLHVFILAPDKHGSTQTSESFDNFLRNGFDLKIYNRVPTSFPTDPDDNSSDATVLSGRNSSIAVEDHFDEGAPSSPANVEDHFGEGAPLSESICDTTSDVSGESHSVCDGHDEDAVRLNHVLLENAHITEQIFRELVIKPSSRAQKITVRVPVPLLSRMTVLDLTGVDLGLHQLAKSVFGLRIVSSGKSSPDIYDTSDSDETANDGEEEQDTADCDLQGLSLFIASAQHADDCHYDQFVSHVQKLKKFCPNFTRFELIGNEKTRIRASDILRLGFESVSMVVSTPRSKDGGAADDEKILVGPTNGPSAAQGQVIEKISPRTCAQAKSLKLRYINVPEGGVWTLDMREYPTSVVQIHHPGLVHYFPGHVETNLKINSEELFLQLSELRCMHFYYHGRKLVDTSVIVRDTRIWKPSDMYISSSIIGFYVSLDDEGTTTFGNMRGIVSQVQSLTLRHMSIQRLIFSDHFEQLRELRLRNFVLGSIFGGRRTLNELLDLSRCDHLSAIETDNRSYFGVILSRQCRISTQQGENGEFGESSRHVCLKRRIRMPYAQDLQEKGTCDTDPVPVGYTVIDYCRKCEEVLNGIGDGSWDEEDNDYTAPMHKMVFLCNGIVAERNVFGTITCHEFKKGHKITIRTFTSHSI